MYCGSIQLKKMAGTLNLGQGSGISNHWELLRSSYVLICEL